MKRYILTGTPGSGKTVLLRALEGRGFFVVEESATDIIAQEQTRGNAEPWKEPAFIDKIVALQRQRQLQTAVLDTSVQLFDRSPVCTLALARYLQFPPSPMLLEELERMGRERIYEKRVLFVESLGICEPTSARTISLEEAAKFEQIHRDTYQQQGYECIQVAAASVNKRVQQVMQELAKLGHGGDGRLFTGR